MAKAQTKKTVKVEKTQIKPEVPVKDLTPIKETIKAKVEEVIPEKVEEAQVDETIKVTRAVAFFNRTDVVNEIGGKDFHLVRYKGVERYWSPQQVEICLRDRDVTLVLDGSVRDLSANKYLEFPKKSQIMVEIKERRNCIGCGR